MKDLARDFVYLLLCSLLFLITTGTTTWAADSLRMEISYQVDSTNSTPPPGVVVAQGQTIPTGGSETPFIICRGQTLTCQVQTYLVDSDGNESNAGGVSVSFSTSSEFTLANPQGSTTVVTNSSGSAQIQFMAVSPSGSIEGANLSAIGQLSGLASASDSIQGTVVGVNSVVRESGGQSGEVHSFRATTSPAGFENYVRFIVNLDVLNAPTFQNAGVQGGVLSVNITSAGTHTIWAGISWEDPGDLAQFDVAPQRVQVFPAEQFVRLGTLGRFFALPYGADNKAYDIPLSFASLNTDLGTIIFDEDQGDWAFIPKGPEGTGQVAATAMGVTGLATVTVIPGDIEVTITPTTATLEPGQEQIFSVLVYDLEEDDEINGTVQPGISWEVQPSSLGTVTPFPGQKDLVRFTAGTSGTGKLVATVAGVEVEANITVGGQMTLAVSPGVIALRRSQRVKFNAVLSNDQGEQVAPSGPVSWSVEPTSLGTIDSTGNFTAGDAEGSGEIVAQVDGLTARATVQVAEIQFVLVGPDPILLRAGDQKGVSLQAFGYAFKPGGPRRRPSRNMDPTHPDDRDALAADFILLGPVPVDWEVSSRGRRFPQGIVSLQADGNDPSKAVLKSNQTVSGFHLRGVRATLQDSTRRRLRDDNQVYVFRFNMVADPATFTDATMAGGGEEDGSTVTNSRLQPAPEFILVNGKAEVQLNFQILLISSIPEEVGQERFTLQVNWGGEPLVVEGTSQPAQGVRRTFEIIDSRRVYRPGVVSQKFSIRIPIESTLKRIRIRPTYHLASGQRLVGSFRNILPYRVQIDPQVSLVDRPEILPHGNTNGEVGLAFSQTTLGPGSNLAQQIEQGVRIPGITTRLATTFQFPAPLTDTEKEKIEEVKSGNMFEIMVVENGRTDLVWERRRGRQFVRELSRSTQGQYRLDKVYRDSFSRTPFLEITAEGPGEYDLEEGTLKKVWTWSKSPQSLFRRSRNLFRVRHWQAYRTYVGLVQQPLSQILRSTRRGRRGDATRSEVFAQNFKALGVFEWQMHGGMIRQGLATTSHAGINPNRPVNDNNLVGPNPRRRDLEGFVLLPYQISDPLSVILRSLQPGETPHMERSTSIQRLRTQRRRVRLSSSQP